MTNCDFCTNEALYAFKDFGAGTFLGSASGGKAFLEDGTEIQPEKVIYGCEDHHQNLYDAAVHNARTAYKANFPQ